MTLTEIPKSLFNSVRTQQILCYQSINLETCFGSLSHHQAKSQTILQVHLVDVHIVGCRMFWAARLRISSRLAPLQAWLVCFPVYRSLCEATTCRLATLGKVKGEGIALRFPFGFWFSCPRLVFLVSSHQLLGSLAGRARSRRLHLQYFLWEGVRDMFCFDLCISKLKFRLCFVTIPDICLAFASGGAGTSYLPVDTITLFCLHTSKWCIWLPYCCLSCLHFTHDKCRVRLNIMLSAICVFWLAVGLSICVVSLHGLTFVLSVVLILWSAVLPCTYCKLTLRRWVCVCTA